jgi:hypothetical protein
MFVDALVGCPEQLLCCRHLWVTEVKEVSSEEEEEEEEDLFI